MVALARARPWEVASLGLRLLQASSAVADAQSAALSSGALRWRGRAAEVFEGRLGRVVRLLSDVEGAYDAAARVLLRYAVELEECALLARRAAEHRVEADRLSAASSLPGPDPGEALRWEAARWEAQAEAQHEEAARRAVAELRELTTAAPVPRDGVSRDRFWSDLRSSLSSQVAATGDLFETSAAALAGNRAARDELVSVVKQSWRVWEPFVEIWHQLADDREGLAAGSSMSALAGRGITPVRPYGRGGRHLVPGDGIAWDEAVQEGRVRHLLAVVGVTTRPYTPGDARLGLYAHEAMNGHAIRQHVAKALTFLRWRADHLGSASTFPDAMTAQRALDRVIRSHGDELEALMRGEVGDYLPVKVEMDEVVGHGYVRGDPLLQHSTVVRGGFQRVEGGIMLVSLYPKV